MYTTALDEMKQKLTQQEKILALMLRNINTQTWFKVSDYQRPDMDSQLFVGYKTSARLNEIEHDYPDIFLYKRDGKFMLRAINREKFRAIVETMPDKMKYFLRGEIAKIKK